MKWWHASKFGVRPRRDLMVAESRFLRWCCACQECIDQYVDDARYYARKHHNSYLELDARAIRQFRNQDCNVIEAGSRLLGWGSSLAVRVCS